MIGNKQPQSISATIFPDGGMDNVAFKMGKDAQKQNEQLRQDKERAARQNSNKDLLDYELDGWSKMYPRLTKSYNQFYDKSSGILANAEIEGREPNADELRQITNMKNNLRRDSEASIELKNLYVTVKNKVEANPDKYNKEETLKRLNYVTNPEQHAVDFGKEEELAKLGAFEYIQKNITNRMLSVLAVNPLEDWATKNQQFLKDITQVTDNSWENSDAASKIKMIERSKAAILNKMITDYNSDQTFREGVNHILAERNVENGESMKPEDLMDEWASPYEIKQRKTFTDFKDKTKSDGDAAFDGDVDKFKKEYGIESHVGKYEREYGGEDIRSFNVEFSDYYAVPNTPVEIDLTSAKGRVKGDAVDIGITKVKNGEISVKGDIQDGVENKAMVGIRTKTIMGGDDKVKYVPLSTVANTLVEGDPSLKPYVDYMLAKEKQGSSGSWESFND